MSLSLGEVTQSLCLLACLLNLAKHFLITGILITLKEDDDCKEEEHIWIINPSLLLLRTSL
jgi:hypothetical protein